MSGDRWGGVGYDRSGGGGGGGPWASVRRVFGDGENPMTWGFPLYRVGGIRVRIHLLFVVYIVAELIRAGLAGHALYSGLVLGMLFLIVLLHEYGHCVACRMVGGEADDILLWPLGGLAYCRPPHRWKADLITTLAGPGVNLVLVPVLGGLLMLAVKDWRAVFFNPFQPGTGWQWVLGSGLSVRALWAAYYTNLLLLAFNMLVPMYPMDAGRVAQALLWSRIGYTRSMEVAVTVGLAAAVCLGVIGVVANEALLLAIAIFGGLTCYHERQRVRFMASGGLIEQNLVVERERGPSKSEIKRRERKREHFEHVERILEKISREGMGGLSRAERRTLEAETKRKQGS